MIGFFALFIGLLLWCLLLYFSGSKHRRNIKQADKCLERLSTIVQPARQFSYLRKVDPFVFEEMILTAFKHLGHKIRRNRRYTGDGGVDGIVYIDKKKYLIQAKRYSGYIDNQHVLALNKLCQRKRCRGLFIHTGKTGRKSWAQSDSNSVEIVSGKRMLSLLLQQNFSLNHLSS